jgi:hypothetical protein
MHSSKRLECFVNFSSPAGVQPLEQGAGGGRAYRAGCPSSNPYSISFKVTDSERELMLNLIGVPVDGATGA